MSSHVLFPSYIQIWHCTDPSSRKFNNKTIVVHSNTIKTRGRILYMDSSFLSHSCHLSDLEASIEVFHYAEAGLKVRVWKLVKAEPNEQNFTTCHTTEVSSTWAWKQYEFVTDGAGGLVLLGSAVRKIDNSEAWEYWWRWSFRIQ